MPQHLETEVQKVSPPVSPPLGPVGSCRGHVLGSEKGAWTPNIPRRDREKRGLERLEGHNEDVGLTVRVLGGAFQVPCQITVPEKTVPPPNPHPAFQTLV